MLSGDYRWGRGAAIGLKKAQKTQKRNILLATDSHRSKFDFLSTRIPEFYPNFANVPELMFLDFWTSTVFGRTPHTARGPRALPEPELTERTEDQSLQL